MHPSYIKYKWLILLIKYIPIIGGLFMMIHCLLLLLGQDLASAHFIFGFSIIGAVILYGASCVLGFCRVHKAFIIYDFCVELCINIEQYYGFGKILIFIRILMLLVGIYLFIWFILSMCNKKCSCKDAEKNFIKNIETFSKSIRC